jgi:hypothetical protein
MLEGNRLIEALSAADQSSMQPYLTETRLGRDDSLFEVGDRVAYSHFPLGTASASYFVQIDEESGIETAMVGAEGYVGGVVNSGGLPAYSRAIVVQPGSFYRIACSDLTKLVRALPALDVLLNRYADCLMADLLQAIACNVCHGIEQRAAKWLCTFAERTEQSVIDITQEQLAARMGSGRSYASRVVQGFKREGLLRTRRGKIEVLDMAGLRGRSCNCNQLVRNHFASVMFNDAQVSVGG